MNIKVLLLLPAFVAISKAQISSGLQDNFAIDRLEWSTETELNLSTCYDNLPFPISAQFYFTCFQSNVSVDQDNSTKTPFGNCTILRADMKAVLGGSVRGQMKFRCILKIMFLNGSYVERDVMIPALPRNSGNARKSSSIPYSWIIIAPIGLIVLAALIGLCCGTLQNPCRNVEPSTNEMNNITPIPLLPVSTLSNAIDYDRNSQDKLKQEDQA